MRLEAVRKRYRRGPEVLAGVDLDLVAGAPVVVLGGNGTGKSTLLRIAAGCSAPSSGRVVGRPRRVGYLPADLRDGRGGRPASGRGTARAGSGTRGVHAVVELRCPVDPAAVVARLPPVTNWWSDGPVLTVRVRAGRGDALLAAALATGCSVLTVLRDP